MDPPLAGDRVNPYIEDKVDSLHAGDKTDPYVRDKLDLPWVGFNIWSFKSYAFVFFFYFTHLFIIEFNNHI